MIATSTFKFLKLLKTNNNKEWFDAHRKEFEEAKNDFLAFVQDIISKLSVLDPEVKDIKAKDCLFRINRDIRFSKDKTPYKTHLGAYISAYGRKSNYPGYYIHIEPGSNMAGGGAYELTPEELKNVRQEIDYNGKEFRKISNAKKFKTIFGEVQGEKLKTGPKGYDASNPMIEDLKFKNWYIMANISDSDLTAGDAVKKILAVYKEMLPFNRFFQQAMKG
jgi:uncharacterized protein (TIGR02453 family)